MRVGLNLRFNNHFAGDVHYHDGSAFGLYHCCYTTAPGSSEIG